MNLEKYEVKPDDEFDLSKIDTKSGTKYDKEKLKEKLLNDIEEIANLQSKLYAENRQSLLIILQGMDGSGKDGTIKHIMSGVNPQSVKVYSFKHPSDLELSHNYLWRHILKLPEHGEITIFNRSHYENVLISRVHPEIVLNERLLGITSIKEINKTFWKNRYQQINDFEKSVIQNGTQILKFFLHISNSEQRDRFLERIDNKEKYWKFSSSDIIERKYWDDYQKAYEHALKNTSPKIVPWYIIPADDKLFAHILISKIILKKLKDMKPSYPPIEKQEEDMLKQVKEQLEQEK